MSKHCLPLQQEDSSRVNKRLKVDEGKFVGVSSLTILSPQTNGEKSIQGFSTMTEIKILPSNRGIHHRQFLTIPNNRRDEFSPNSSDKMYGKVTGIFETYLNGMLIKSMSYHNGKKHGLCLAKRDDITTTIKYLSDRKCGYEIYSTDGEVSSNDNKYINGRKVLAYNFYFDNIRHGLFSDSTGFGYYLYGTKVSEESFKEYYHRCKQVITKALTPKLISGVIEYIFDYVNHYNIYLNEL
jgi:hypothetical protein